MQVASAGLHEGDSGRQTPLAQKKPAPHGFGLQASACSDGGEAWQVPSARQMPSPQSASRLQPTWAAGAPGPRHWLPTQPGALPRPQAASESTAQSAAPQANRMIRDIAPIPFPTQLASTGAGIG